MQTLISQYYREMGLLAEVYQQRLSVEVPVFTQTIVDLCVALKQTEWQRKAIFKQVVKLVIDTPPFDHHHQSGSIGIFDLLMEKVTAEYKIVCVAQENIAKALELSTDTSTIALRTCIDVLTTMSPQNNQSMAYIKESLNDIEKCHQIYDALLHSNKWHWQSTVALIRTCMDLPEQSYMCCDR